MKIILTLTLFLGSFLQAGVLETLSRNKQVVVVYGKDAPEEEKDLAKKIYSALELDNTGDLYDHIIADDYALKHKFFYSSFHLIIVGSVKTNRLFGPLADIQTVDLNSKKPSLPALSKINPLSSGVHFARYGHFDKDTGYIRRMLNPFALESFNLTNGKSATGPATATYISGTSADGLSRAYVEMLDSNLLEGVLPPEEALAEKTSRFQLGRESILFPDGLRKDMNFAIGQNKLNYVGWIQGALADYSGTYKMTGIMPQQICHLKFASKTLTLMTYDDHSNSLLAIKFNDAAESLKALTAFDQTMKLALKIDQGDALKVYHCVKGQNRWLMIRQGKWLIIENLPMAWKDELAKNAAILFQ